MSEQSIVLKKEAVGLFGEYASALYEGKISQLRFALTPQPESKLEDQQEYWSWTEPRWRNGHRKGLSYWPKLAEFLKELQALCPYGQPGDVLWVKEAWRTLSGYNALKPSELPTDVLIHYEVEGESIVAGRYRHAPCMPRWASRLVLEIIAVRVERAWDMTEADALACGIQRILRGFCDGVGGLHVTAKAACRSFFLTTQGAIWHSNPWVWVVGFKQAKITLRYA
jgi:hypothetical protein